MKRSWFWFFVAALLIPGCFESAGYQVASSKVTYVTRDAAGYSHRQVVEGADPATFSVIREPFAKDSNKVYYHGFPLEGASPQGFEILDDDYYSTDGKLVFAGRNLISHDPEGFTILAVGYSKDSQQVFHFGQVVEGAMAESFELLEGPGSYARDAVGAYREGKVIVGADGSHFEPLNYYYSRDGKQVFHEVKLLEGADPESFYTEPKRQLARDKNGAWYMDFKLDLDGSKTEFLDGLYLKDGQKVYYGNRLIEGADATGFETYTQNGTVYGRDKNGTYSSGRLKD